MTRPPSEPSNWTQNEVADLEERAELAEKRLEELRSENERLRVLVEKRGLPIDMFNDCEQLTREIERLQEKIEQYKDIASWDWLQQQERIIWKLNADLDKAKGKNKRLRQVFKLAHKDAERYRWLKDNAMCYDGKGRGIIMRPKDPGEITIDEAMKDE
jgi:DNA repair exonuclease SbcCD ATPase subunit